MGKYSFLTFIFLAVMFLLFTERCANPVAPTGGPQDIYPPVVTRSVPPNYTTNFKSDRIQIYFDEFVKLKDPNNEIFISPPFNKNPEYKERGKSLIIDFQEPLIDSTTYVIYFGKAIVDITEGNPLELYSYVFSTGDKIDSLSLIGVVRNGFDMEARPDVLVMLYENDNDTIPMDSLPYFVKPIYVVKTLDDGRFLFSSLKGGEFLLFALSDINNNYIYDLPDEEIAFEDTLIEPFFWKPEERDSIFADSLQRSALGKDTTVVDTGYYLFYGRDSLEINIYARDTGDVVSADTLPLTPLLADTAEKEYPFITLLMFKEIDSIQRLKDARLVKDKLLSFAFRYPTVDPRVVPLNLQKDTTWRRDEWNATRDTLKLWFHGLSQDSMFFEVIDDTLVLDTVELSLETREERGLFRRRDEGPESLKFNTNVKDGKLDLYKPLEIRFPYPLIKADFSGVLLIEGKDSAVADLTFADTLLKRIAILDHPWKEDQDYHLFFRDSIMTDFLGHSNDTTRISFATTTVEDYGILYLNLEVEDLQTPYIIQLMAENKKILDERIITGPELLVFEYLRPGKYILKAIRDTNKNGRWDTGEYHKKRQPEYVEYFSSVLEIRANWEIEENWELKK